MSAPDGRRARHLLVVDDDDRIRELLKEYLARAGFRVTAAADAARGAPAAGACSTSTCWSLDVMMPGEDGFALDRGCASRPGEPGRRRC